jgi:hypothetical protein
MHREANKRIAPSYIAQEKQTMNQRPKSTSPEKVGTPDEAKAAFEDIRAELAKLSPEEVLTVNIDIPRAASIALGAEPHIRSYEAEIKRTLPSHDLKSLRKLRSYALGAVYAHLDALPVSRRADLTELTNEASELKPRLLVAAEALAHAELLNTERVAEIRSGNGNLDLATDLLALGALFDAHWKLIANKTAIERAQVERASQLGTELLVALGAKDHSANRSTPEALDARNRAFTLLVNAYDDARRALAYLRFAEGDVDEIAPSLYQRPRKRSTPPATPPEPPSEPGVEVPATPSPAAVAPVAE